MKTVYIIQSIMLASFMSISQISLSVEAQAQSKYKKILTSADSQAIAAASALADTGRMAPAFQNVEFYRTPGHCLAATQMLTSHVWGSPPDTMPNAAVRQMSRQCLRRMDVSNVDEMDLYHLIELSAVADDTAAMLKAVSYYQSLDDKTTHQSIQLLRDAVTIAGRHRVSGRIDFAKSMLERLKKYGPESIYATYLVWSGLKNHANAQFDTSKMIRIVSEQNAYFRQFDQEQIKAATPDRVWTFDSVTSKYSDLRTFAVYKNNTSLKDTMDTFAVPLIRNVPTWKRPLYNETYVATSRLGQDPSKMELVGAFPEGISEKPELGKVTLYVTRPPKELYFYFNKTLATLKRLYEDYHKDGLEIVIVTHLQGYVANSPPLSPEDEAKALAWVVREYHGLPFGVLVNRNDIVRLDDGRIRRRPTLYSKFFDEDGEFRGTNQGYIVGRDGKVKVVNQFAVMGSYARAAAFIEKALEE